MSLVLQVFSYKPASGQKQPELTEQSATLDVLLTPKALFVYIVLEAI